MNKQELEIAKKIAQIEFNSANYSIEMRSDCVVVRNLLRPEPYIYNPFDWPILGPLMVKYDVGVHTESGLCVIEGVTGIYSSEFGLKEDIPRAILECIIKSQEK